MRTLEQKVAVTPNGSLVVLTPLYARYIENTDIWDMSTLSGSKGDSFKVSFNYEDEKADLYMLEYDNDGSTQVLNSSILDELQVIGDL